MTKDDDLVLKEFDRTDLALMNRDQRARYLGTLANVAGRIVSSSPSKSATVADLAGLVSAKTRRSVSDSASAILFGIREGLLAEDDFKVVPKGGRRKRMDAAPSRKVRPSDSSVRSRAGVGARRKHLQLGVS